MAFELTKKLFLKKLLNVTDDGLNFRGMELQSFTGNSFAVFLQTIASRIIISNIKIQCRLS